MAFSCRTPATVTDLRIALITIFHLMELFKDALPFTILGIRPMLCVMASPGIDERLSVQRNSPALDRRSAVDHLHQFGSSGAHQPGEAQNFPAMQAETDVLKTVAAQVVDTAPLLLWAVCGPGTFHSGCAPPSWRLNPPRLVSRMFLVAT